MDMKHVSMAWIWTGIFNLLSQGFSTIDHIYALTHLFEKAKEYNLEYTAYL